MPALTRALLGPVVLGPVLLATLIALPGRPASAAPALPSGDQLSRIAPDRAVITPAPRADGNVPGYLVSEGSGGTKLRALDAASPTPVDLGRPAVPVGKAITAPLHELRLSAIARDGRPAAGQVTVFDVRTGAGAGPPRPAR